ncbi:DMT family transporter [Thermoactinospora rubra]|uniref:DMT family transporter n=1 Tax=Thermoactinospora rubra TaxID=1088767 RepID=UPI001301F4B5|nr:DMT family transporter [Thermoactinospora rubra]
MLLLFVSAAWGSAFPLMDDLISRLAVQDVLATRYSLAALTLFLIRPSCLRGLSRATWGQAALLGLMFGVGQFSQAWGLHGLTSSVSGFAVGCGVVITPVLGLLVFKTPVPWRIWVGVALALGGMTTFTLLGGEHGKLSYLALAATLGAAVLYSIHTLALGHMSRKRRTFDAYAVTVIQLGVIGLLTGVAAAPGGLELPERPMDWLIMAHLAVVSCALGFLARSYGQKHVPAVPSSIMMSSQPLWVAAIAVLGFGEAADWQLLVGGGLTVAAMLLAVPAAASRPRRKPRDRELLEISRRASRVLGQLRHRPAETVRFEGGPMLILTLSACENTDGCPWRTMAAKGTDEPNLDRLIARAALLARAHASHGCCEPVILSGRCLCSLMEEAERRNSEAASWFRTD